jgi:Mrp family chromosome partitioning ATPase
MNANLPLMLAQDLAAKHDTDGRVLTRRTEGRELTPAQLEELDVIPCTHEARATLDSFRSIRTRLLATSNDNFVTMVAPVSHGCGGSFVARNLAVALTLDPSKSALLVDCNLRNPSQDKSLRVNTSGGGLINFLENSDEDMAGIVCKTDIPGLSLIPAGASRRGATEAEYFSSFRFRLLLAALRCRDLNRYIFLDAPPVKGAPDARILSEIADVVVLVAGYGRDTPTAISEAAANFDPNKFIGVVFNEGT